jgi:uncharacterized protein YqhQ
MPDSSRIGGQAVPEGVMLRGPGGWAVAVRRPDGTIVVTEHPVANPPHGFWQKPFVRGLHTLVTAMPLGMRAMRWAVAQLQPAPVALRPRRTRANNAVSLLAGIVIAALLFGLLPAYLAGVFSSGDLAGRVVEPLFRTLTIVAYIAAIGLLPEVRRVFAYHGAEHQVVAAHEHGVMVTPSSASGFPRFHSRCGTTFVIIVALLDGLLHALSPRHTPLGVGLRLAQLPIAIMLAYELLYAAVERPHRRWARCVLAPGRALQRLTTRSPDREQLEVACAALDAVLQLEDQDEQQDDEQQDDESTPDIHAGLLHG